MGTARSSSLVFDAGALIAFERGDEYMRALIRRARSTADSVIPAAVLAQVWRDGSTQASLSALLKAPRVHVDVLDELGAKAAGALCGRSKTKDVIDACVVLSARLRNAIIVTSDPQDIRAIDPHVAIEAL